ncbi:MAG: DUF2752 domain-containing protein [Thermoanaerobaculia bacterium]
MDRTEPATPASAAGRPHHGPVIMIAVSSVGVPDPATSSTARPGPMGLRFAALRHSRFLVALSCLTASTALAGWLGGFVVTLDDFPICIFRAVTGRPCIFCGMSHAVIFAVRGNWGMASQANGGWYVILPLFLVLTASVISGRARLGWPIVGVIVVATIVRALAA